MKVSAAGEGRGEKFLWQVIACHEGPQFVAVRDLLGDAGRLLGREGDRPGQVLVRGVAEELGEGVPDACVGERSGAGVVGGEEMGGERVSCSGGESPPVQGAVAPVEDVELACEDACARFVVVVVEVGHQPAGAVSGEHSLADAPDVVEDSRGLGRGVGGHDGTPAAAAPSDGRAGGVLALDVERRRRFGSGGRADVGGRVGWRRRGGVGPDSRWARHVSDRGAGIDVVFARELRPLRDADLARAGRGLMTLLPDLARRATPPLPGHCSYPKFQADGQNGVAAELTVGRLKSLGAMNVAPTPYGTYPNEPPGSWALPIIRMLRELEATLVSLRVGGISPLFFIVLVPELGTWGSEAPSGLAEETSRTRTQGQSTSPRNSR